MWKRSTPQIFSILRGRATKSCPLITISSPVWTRSISYSNVIQAPKGNRGKKTKKSSEKPKPVNFIIPNYLSVDKLSNLLNCRVTDLIKDLGKLGFKDVTNKYILTKEYIELILQEYNYELPNSNLELNSSNVYDSLKQAANPNNLEKRPPVVTIMGHIDHGKTTIIDHLRKSSVVDQEHGGITQHIGAFQVITPISKKKITFLDTPGHAAFLKMRERGANITDIIILVVSIEDSIMPQTIEAIKHIKNSGNELIVAITKIDKATTPRERERMLEKVTNDLIAQEIPVEKIGGDVQVIPISARTGENMDLLEESIIALSDLMDIRSENSKSTMVEGWVLESQVKKMMGNVGTVLVKKGTLRKGDILVCGNTYCKVKNMLTESHNQTNEALPSQAITVLGWKDLPIAGDEVIQVPNESIAKKSISRRLTLIKSENDMQTVLKLNEQNAQEKLEKEKNDIDEDEDEDDIDEHVVEETGPKKINFIIKADVSGSAEAIKDSLTGLGNNEVESYIVSTSVGNPNESDLKMAKITDSKILCFNLGSLPSDIVNNKEGIEIRQYNVIYKLIEDVTEILTNNLAPIYENKNTATVEIREIFNYSLKKKQLKVAGCKVINGKITRNSLVKVVRGDEQNQVYDGRLSTLKQGKDDTAEVSKGKECGITFQKNFDSYQPGDKIIAYEKVKVQRYL
ncbi:hypothetical protein Kpol_1024p13 [Vanderwaltozyma polyspora DSM 70294]|uniref:Translation initiation factor IF-2, mitochondrial n=1 Tax=Vanderwaltozyma polyspora (strain ATCC 22028 / DSM 70294 / BCRC 21397 / CBS 2163 / NBRC 10782 / NRRL Y-8283 / UCD 57-17) TaxID=436907 RepID=A7TLH4_VANPO|nr:uncharacterized protein Kpol_1024p13 [Vanderwaltozyma polyspora DSM 70294]EDO16860.1 hypothetical protein Kpol_1024p13 [Vanderwaltozyma polyspora DSM 70294]